MSLAARLGLPEAVQTALLLAAIALTLAPYFAGMTIGSLQIPVIAPGRRRRIRFTGPLMLAGAVALVLPLSGLQPPPIELRLIAADVTASGDIDAVVSNAGTAPALLTSIELEVLTERHVAARPELLPGATVSVPVDDLAPGGRRRTAVRLLVAPKSVERIVISPRTGRGLLLRLRIRASDGAVMTSDVDLLMEH